MTQVCTLLKLLFVILLASGACHPMGDRNIPSFITHERATSAPKRESTSYGVLSKRNMGPTVNPLLYPHIPIPTLASASSKDVSNSSPRKDSKSAHAKVLVSSWYPVVARVLEHKTNIINAKSATLSTTTSTGLPDQTVYLLKAVVTQGAVTQNNLYISSFHTGAGLGDAVMSPKANALPVFFNGTYVQFQAKTPFPWSFDMSGSTSYIGWAPVRINAGMGSSGFYFNNNDGNGTGLKWNEGNGTMNTNRFKGWLGKSPLLALFETVSNQSLVCDWNHGKPQLFWRVGGSIAEKWPESCSGVALEKTLLDGDGNPELNKETDKRKHT